MKVRWTANFVAASIMSLAASAAATQSGITEQEAHALGVSAYLYFYPLITMDITRKQLTNVEQVEGIHGPMNTFVSLREYPSADMKVVVRPNFDTLYTSAFLDLTAEPMIVSAPGTDGRYYLLPMLDMWTDVFASPGWRTTGTQVANFLVTPPAGTETLLQARPALPPLLLMCGSSAGQKRMVRRTTTQSTRYRRATRSLRCRNGVARQNRCLARSIRRST